MTETNEKRANDVSSKKKSILLSAGGTGGHVFPAIALAQDLLSRGYRVEIVIDSRALRYKESLKDVPYHVLPSGTLGSGLAGKVKGVFSLGAGVTKAFSLLRKLKPAVVVGFGGYPSFPAVYAAQKKHIPTVVHEQNAVIGKANLMLAPKADRIALSLPRTEDLADADIVRSVVTGNPVRANIASLYNKPYAAPETDGEFHIFVMGGSLGATVFSKVLPVALEQLDPIYKNRLRITQQCREADLAEAESLYKSAGIDARLATFFDDIPEILEHAHLIIGRAGASTVAEITAAGRPAIFVPYPHHTDDQQRLNAETVSKVGGAWIMDEKGFHAESLLPRLENFLQNPEALFHAAEASRSCGRPDAARRLGNLVTALASGWDKKRSKRLDITQGHEV